MRKKPPVLLIPALIAFCVAALPLYAGRVILKVPAPSTNLGGTGASGASILASPGSINGIQLITPTLTGSVLTSVANPRVLRTGPKSVAPVLPAKVLPTRQKAGTKEAVSGPAVGNEQFQKALQAIGEGSADIQNIAGDQEGSSRDGGKAVGIGRKIFDGSGIKKGSGGGVVDGNGGVGSSGFNGGRRGPDGGNFVRSLLSYGMPRPVIGRLLGILKTTHPGDQKKIYHNLGHSVRVPNVLAAILDGPAGKNLTNGVKATLLIAAALHDVDPERTPGTPARVAATLEYLDSSPAAQALFAELKVSQKTVNQIKTLIKFTDFNPDPVELAKIQADAESMAKEHFGAEAEQWSDLGRLLAFADQTAMYLDTVEFAEEAVVGLAHEIGAPADAILKGTAKFLEPLTQSPHFALLPAHLQGNFKSVLAHFQRLAGPPAAAEDQGRSRAPPKKAATQTDSDDPLLILGIEHTGPGYTEGYVYNGRPLRYFDGSGSKILFHHPNFRDYLLTLFPKKSPQPLARLTKEQRESEKVEATMTSRRNRAAELAGREFLMAHKLTPPMPLKAGRMMLRDMNGEEWNTSYLVQERIYGNNAEDLDSADLALVRRLLNRLLELRIKVPADVNISRNIVVGWTPKVTAKRAYVVDAEGTEYVGPQSRFASWTGQADALKAHYDEMWAQISKANRTAANKRSLDTGAKSPHPIRSADDAVRRQGRADESTWWRNRDFDGARGPIMTLGEALANVKADDLVKLKTRLAELRPGLTFGQGNVDYRTMIEKGAALRDPDSPNPYRHFIMESGVFQGQAPNGFTTGLPLERMFAVNKVTRDKIAMPAEDKFDQPAFVMGALYNLLFDYSGQLRDPVKVDYLIDYVLRLK